MNFSIFHHEFLTPQQAKTEFDLNQYFHPDFLRRYLSKDQRILVLREDVALASFDGEDLAGDADFVIFQGNLTVKQSIDVSHSDYDILGFLVLGDLKAASLTAGDTFITIKGQAELQRYLYCPRPPYESGEFRVDGKFSVPVYLQEDYNPNLIAPRFECPHQYSIENDIEAWPEEFYDDETKANIKDVEGLVDFILQDTQRPPEQRYFFDWIAAYDLNRKQFHEAERQTITQGYCDDKNIIANLAEDWLAPRLAEDLKWLEIADIRIQQLPAQIADCYKLQQIKFDNCFSHLQQLPDLSGLKALRKLEINGGNQDSTRHPVSATQHLKTLLSYDFPRLDYLSINFWNAATARLANGEINQRPALQASDLTGIGKFQRLKVVSLYGNGLRELPDEFYTLKELRYIRIIDAALSEACIERLQQHFDGQAKVVVG